MAKEEAPTCEICGAKLIINYIITGYHKYERNRRKIGIDPIFDISLGPEIGNNSMMIAFLKSTNLYNSAT